MDQLPTTRLSPNSLRRHYEEKHPKTLYTRLERNTTGIHDKIVQTCDTEHCYLINLRTGTILYGRPKYARFNYNVDKVFYYSATNDTIINNLKRSPQFGSATKPSISDLNVRNNLVDLYAQGENGKDAINRELTVILKNITKTSKYFPEHVVGDSDNDLSDSDTDETIYFTPEKAVRPKEVTLQGKNNDDSGNTRIKGASLIRACHKLSQKAAIKACKVVNITNTIGIFHERDVSCSLKLQTLDEYNLIKDSITTNKIIPNGYHLGQLIHFKDANNNYCLRQISLNQNNEYILKVLTLKNNHSPNRLEDFIFSNVYEPEEGEIPNFILISINKMLNEMANYEPKEILEFKEELFQGKLPNEFSLGQLILIYSQETFHNDIYCGVYQINCTNNQNNYSFDKLEFNSQNQLRISLEDFAQGVAQRNVDMREKNIKKIFNGYTSYHINNPRSWLINVGKWSRSQAKSEIEPDAPSSSSRIFTIGHNLKLSVEFGECSERMHLPTHFTVLGELVSDYSVLGNSLGQKTDLSYDRIIKVFNHICSECNISDKKFASLQLALLKFDNSAVSNIFAEIGVNEEQKKLEIINFIHFFNALIFGVEASRVNATLVTGVMTLKLIKSGKLTYTNAFAANEYGGMFPLATLKSYGGNFAARRMLIASNVTGLKLDRQYPQWLAISLKEAKIVKLWAKHVLSQQYAISRNNKTKDIRQSISTGIEDIFKEYYNIEFTTEDEVASLMNSLQISDNAQKN